MRSGNWNSAYKGLQSRLTMGLFRLLYIAGSQRPVKIDELRHATTIWTPGDLPHRHWPSYRAKTICFVLVMFIYLIYVGRVLPVHNQLLDGYTRPHWHSTRPKDGWTGPWMRQWCSSWSLGSYIEYLIHFIVLRAHLGQLLSNLPRVGAFTVYWVIHNILLRTGT